MTVVVPNSDKGLEPGLLASPLCSCTGMILRTSSIREKVDNLGFFNGQGEQVDSQGLDLLVLNQAAQLGGRDPLLITTSRSASTTAMALATVLSP